MSNTLRGFIFVALLGVSGVKGAVHYVDVNNSTPEAPYLDWNAAANTIQDAIDASAAGDVIWVTDGVYSTGGKAMAGDLTNRVALDKAVAVLSLNGPGATTIQGAWDPSTTNGPLAVRCAWLTNDAVLEGFTLQGGATRNSGATATTTGGGAWCFSNRAELVNCVIRANSALSSGGGVYQGSLKNCFIASNSVVNFNGGGGCYFSVLNGCTVVGNTGYGVSGGTLTNCIVYFNAGFNYLFGTLRYCCTTPPAPGLGNISTDPQLLGDGLHLASTSPCRGAGTIAVTSTDIDGQPWSTPPAIGCDEWNPAPLVMVQPQVRMLSNAIGFNVTAAAAGQDPLTWTWFKDGQPLDDDQHFVSTHSSTLLASGVQYSDAGSYFVVVSNAFGVSTSAMARVVIHCVDAQAASPAPPYVEWAGAARNIQDAIDAAAPGEFVFVTNGVYSGGGKAIVGDLTNRVALDKALTVLSMNGPAVTMIQGAWDPANTNGPMAVRCAWLTNGAVLAGFTLQGGATRLAGDQNFSRSGGGVWGASTNARVVNCLIQTNAASYGGGGCYQAYLEHCTLRGNVSQWGGGAYQAPVVNSLIQANSANDGGGVYLGRLTNCTVTLNHAESGGGGIEGSVLVYNSIVYNNSAGRIQGSIGYNWSGAVTFYSSCTSPMPFGINNIASDPELLDQIHLASTSPCRGAGSIVYSSGLDIDAEAWRSPPSMGCDEYVESGLTGPLALQLASTAPRAVVGRPCLLYAQLTGRAIRVEWSFGDGSVITNASPLILFHTWTNPGDYTVTFTAFNVDHPAGVSTNLVMRADPLAAPLLSSAALSGNRFGLTFPSQYGVLYFIEYTTNLAPPVLWQTATITSGDGTIRSVSDFNATNEMRFYRVRTQ